MSKSCAVAEEDTSRPTRRSLAMACSAVPSRARLVLGVLGALVARQLMYRKARSSRAQTAGRWRRLSSVSQLRKGAPTTPGGETPRADTSLGRTLIVVKNYTGDVLQFGLAKERWSATHKDDDVRMVIVGAPACPRSEANAT